MAIAQGLRWSILGAVVMASGYLRAETAVTFANGAVLQALTPSTHIGRVMVNFTCHISGNIRPPLPAPDDCQLMTNRGQSLHYSRNQSWS